MSNYLRTFNEMISFSASKSIILKTNTPSKSITYVPVEDEFQKKISNIAVGNISYRCQPRINCCVAVTSNFVTSRRYNNIEKRIENYEVPLAVFQLKTTGAENVSVTRITPIWFDLNSKSEKLEFSLINMENDQKLELPQGVCTIMLGVFFK